MNTTTVPQPVLIDDHVAVQARLTEAHRRELEAGSAIHPDVIRERGYLSVSAGKVPAGFAGYQRRDGLLVPLHSVWGEVRTMQLKPDTPRTSGARPIKYESMAGQPPCIDVPKRSLPFIGDPRVPLWITEGAKKADSAVSNGIECVINLTGVFGWRGKNEMGGKTALPDWEQIALNDRDVILAFDSDCMTKRDVRRALDRLAAFLKSRGAAIGYCLLPPMPDGSKCGLDDFLAQGKSFDDLRDCLALELPPLDTEGEFLGPIPDILRVSDVEAEEISWLWEGWIPRRMLTILGGHGGDGKSTVMTSLIGAWTNGGTLPDGTAAPRCNVLMLSAEDDPSYAIKPRLDAHKADATRVFILRGTREQDGTTRWLNLKRDVETMERVINEHEIDLVVIDPLSSYLPSADRNNEGDIRDALQPLMSLIERTDVAVVGIMHVGKATDGRRASQRLIGSTAFTALARSVIMVADIPDDQQPDDVEERGKQKVLQVVKSNYAIAPPPQLFRRPLDAAIQWHGESAIGIEECLAGGSKPSEKMPERDDAKTFLIDILADGPVPQAEVMTEGKALGFSEQTIRRAKDVLGITARKVGYQGKWHWHLPEALTSSKGGQTTL